MGDGRGEAMGGKGKQRESVATDELFNLGHPRDLVRTEGGGCVEWCGTHNRPRAECQLAIVNAKLAHLQSEHQRCVEYRQARRAQAHEMLRSLSEDVSTLGAKILRTSEALVASPPPRKESPTQERPT